MADEDENKLTERVTVRFSVRDLAAIHDAAAQSGKEPGAFIRRAAVFQAKQLQLFPEPKSARNNKPKR